MVQIEIKNLNILFVHVYHVRNKKNELLVSLPKYVKFSNKCTKKIKSLALT